MTMTQALQLTWSGKVMNMRESQIFFQLVHGSLDDRDEHTDDNPDDVEKGSLGGRSSAKELSQHSTMRSLITSKKASSVVADDPALDPVEAADAQRQMTEWMRRVADALPEQFQTVPLEEKDMEAVAEVTTTNHMEA